MPNSKELFIELTSQIQIDEPREETESIVYWIFQELFHVNRSEVMMGREIPLIDRERLDSIIRRLNNREPVQYVFGVADFFGRKFKVDRSVLIPRPETEILVKAVIEEKGKRPLPAILDIGTGSGCIAVTLSLELPQSTVSAIDVSAEAIKIAKENCIRLGAKVEFVDADFLHSAIALSQFDVIVSNPPYIAVNEKDSMSPSVVDYEPATALFVSNDDPLFFYRVIGERAVKTSAKLFFEIHSARGHEVVELLRSLGYRHIRIRKDFNGMDRVVVAEK
jgi:release factor glutamine methyltransferase